MLQQMVVKIFSALSDLAATIVLSILAGIFFIFISVDEALDGDPNQKTWDF